MKNIFALSYTALSLIGIFVCLICDLALSGTLTWSPIPIISITFAWLVFLPFLRSAIHGLTAVTLFTIPYLYTLSKLLPAAALLFPIGIRMTVIATGYLWCVCLLFKLLRTYKAAAAACLLVIPVCIIINFCLAEFTCEPLADRWDILTFSIMGITSLLLFLLDRKKAGK